MKVEEEGIQFHGNTWHFDILLCTDLKAYVNLLGYGGYHDDLKSCCSDSKAQLRGM